MRVQDHRYLVIGGAPKAGTTSLYKWLASHPDVCASSLKETRFFLDEGYPLPSAKRFDGQNLDYYDGFFTHCRDAGDKLRVEATPDYLYSKNALQIAELLPKAKIVFILRDPVDRVVSWYKYARQRGLISPKMGFEEYVRWQIDNPVTYETPVYMRALEQSRYEKYLEKMKMAFSDRCMITSFENIKNKPYETMLEVCKHVDIESKFYENYKFHAENVSRAETETLIGRIYSVTRSKIAYMTHASPMAYNILRPINGMVKSILPINRKNDKTIVVDDNGLRLVMDALEVK